MQTSTVRKRVVVVDRRRLIREGLSSVLRAEPGLEIVAALARGDDLADVGDPFDVIVTNLPRTEVPRGAGTTVLTYSDERTPKALVVALTVDVPAEPVGDEASVRRRLTPREVQVMRGIADGLSSAEIAAGLEIAPKSVENHKQRIFAKLQVHSQAHAVTVSLADGLLASATDSRRAVAGPGRPMHR